MKAKRKREGKEKKKKGMIIGEREIEKGRNGTHRG